MGPKRKQIDNGNSFQIPVFEKHLRQWGVRQIITMAADINVSPFVNTNNRC